MKVVVASEPLAFIEDEGNRFKVLSGDVYFGVCYYSPELDSWAFQPSDDEYLLLGPIGLRVLVEWLEGKNRDGH